MFVMCSNGGHPRTSGPNATAAARRTLRQRIFIFRLLSSGIAVASLENAEFIDSKVSLEEYISREDCLLTSEFFLSPPRRS